MKLTDTARAELFYEKTALLAELERNVTTRELDHAEVCRLRGRVVEIQRKLEVAP